MWLDELNAMKRSSGKTTDQIAKESGIPKGTLNKIFAGQTKEPKITTMTTLVHCLGHTLDDLEPVRVKKSPALMNLEIINALKKEKGLTNAQLAQKAGVTLSTIDKITAGINKNPKLDTLQAICEVLGCTLDTFLDKDKNSPALAEASTGEISLEESNNLLVSLGYIKPGEQVSDKDLAFLGHVIGLLDTWFESH